MATLSHDEIQELLGAFALDAVDTDERDLIDAHLVDCARCRAEVAEHREAAAMLAFTGVSAPDGLWQRVAESLDGAPPAPPLVLPIARRRRPPWAVSIALSAAAALIIAVLGVQVRDQSHRIDDLETAMADPIQQALAQPGARSVALTSADRQVLVRGVVTATGEGYLRASTLPMLGEGRTYQLWGRAGADLVSLGILGRSPGVVSFHDAGYDLFAITDEAAPGVVRTANQPIVSTA